MVYKYKWEGNKYGVPAAVFGAHCETIKERDGIIKSQAIVDDARDETSELHKLFEWDDEIAGEKWRNKQAKDMLTCLKITVIKDDKEESTVKAFVNVSSEPRQQGMWLDIHTALSEEDTRAIVLANAKRELQVIRNKYNTLTELSDVWKAIDTIA